MSKRKAISRYNIIIKRVRKSSATFRNIIDCLKKNLKYKVTISISLSVHCIVFHSRVFWEDLLNVDDLWMEFNIGFQFFIDKNQDWE